MPRGLPIPAAGLLLALLLTDARAADQETDFFERRIRPVLVEHCYRCHSSQAQTVRGGLRLDSPQSLRQGGDSGALFTPGDPRDSLLLEALRHESFEMPPDRRLPDGVIEDFRRWIAAGAVDPRPAEASPEEPPPPAMDLEEARKHWAFQPLSPAPPPSLSSSSAAESPIDAYLERALRREGLAFSPTADRLTLIRRLTFDLWGLPPSPEAIRAFQQDPAPLPVAAARLADRLLASPRFGERWGRHWLDVARYADSTGGGRSLLYRESWRYRDYVIRSFAQDKPLDRFVIEQLAGDLLPAADSQAATEQVIATAFLALGPHNYEQQDKELLRMDVVDEQIDTVGRVLLGMTLGCARCHDHKFDPIPAEDYYALAGVFRSTLSLVDGNVSQWVTRSAPLDPRSQEEIRRHAEQLQAAERKLQGLRGRLASLREADGGPLVDDEHPGVKFTGPWTVSKSVSGYVGEGYRHSASAEATAAYAIEAPQPGEYELLATHTAHGNRTRQAVWTIHHRNGTTIRRVDQTQAASANGESLGRYWFDERAVLELSSGGRGVLVADAVRLRPIGLDEEAPDDRRRQALLAAEAAVGEAEAAVRRLREQAPPPPPKLICVAEQPPEEIGDCRVRIRGNHQRLGESVPRGVLQAALRGPAPQFPADASGRLELARWIVSPDNPLTARVLANRIWSRLMGTGLVRTTENFGRAGEAPSHPELLDYLAARLVAGGWSAKALIREIVLSHGYLQSDQPSAEAAARDPDNRWLSHQNRVRLDAEALHDALLLLSGLLREELGGDTMRNGTTNEYGYEFELGRRAAYYPIFRNRLPDLLQAFDFPDPNRVAGRRNVSTLPSQSLVLLNSPSVIEMARGAAAETLRQPPEGGAAARLERFYLQALSRPPTPAEASAARRFLAGFLGPPPDAWAVLCQTVMASADFRFR